MNSLKGADCSLIMVVPMFVDLQQFVVGKRFVVKEIAILREGNVFAHYMFVSPLPWNFLSTKFDKSRAFIMDCYRRMELFHSPIQHGERIDYNGRDWYR